MVGRRRFMAGVGAAGVSLAASQLLRPLAARAGGEEIPKRLLLITSPNGIIEDAWRPTGGETDFVLGRMLAPLERHREKLIVLGPDRHEDWFRALRGVSCHVIDEAVEDRSGGHGWQRQMSGALSRQVGDASYAGGPSIDQVVAPHVRGETPFASVQLGIRSGNGTASFNAAGEGVPAENDPALAFERIFRVIGEPDPSVMRQRRRRGSILDFTRGEIGALRPRLGSSDRALLDQHESAIRDIERTLTTTFECVPPTDVGAVEPNGWDTYTNMQEIARMQREITVSALACDLTRVAMLQYAGAASNTRHPWLGGRAEEWHHTLSHDPNEPAAREGMIQIGEWHAEHIAGLLDRLAATPERDGSTVLDHTLIVWINELSDGFYHTHQNMPVVLAGGLGGHFRTGRYLQYHDASLSDLWLSIAHAMGLTELTTFGDPRFCTGPLAGLT